MNVLLEALIGWFLFGLIMFMWKMMEDGHLFDNFSYSKGRQRVSWGQIVLMCIAYGPAWLIIIPLFILGFGIYFFCKRIKILWNLLSEIGPR